MFKFEFIIYLIKMWVHAYKYAYKQQGPGKLSIFSIPKKLNEGKERIYYISLTHFKPLHI